MSSGEHNFTPQIMLVYDVRRAAPPALFAALMELRACAAALIYDSGGAADAAAFQAAAAALMPSIQNSGAAALIAGDSALCGRLKADGLHIEAGGGQSEAQAKALLAAQAEKYGKKRLLGYGGAQSRHEALEAGELCPDYLFFGKLGMDKKPAPHKRNLSLAAWWAEIMRIDCVAQAGASLEHLPAALSAKAEFVALEEMIFGASEPVAALRAAQAALAQVSKD